MTPKLNLLVLRATDLPAMVRFYGALGIEFVEEQHSSGPVHYSGNAGGTLLELYPIANGANTTSVRLGFSVLSLSSSVAAVVAVGGEVVSPPKISSWGNRAVVTDPEGHRVELLEQVQPGAPIDGSAGRDL